MNRTSRNLSLSLVLMTSSLFSAACAAPYELRSGNRVTLIKPLTIPAGASLVYIQKQTVTTNGALINQYYANCSFEQHDLAKTDRTLSPTGFVVVRSMLDVDHPTRGQYEFRTVAYLVADVTNENFIIECRHWGEWGDTYLTQAEIQAALIDYFVIKN